MNTGLRDVSDFDKCVIYQNRIDGAVKISCQLGLWSVSGPHIEAVEREAMHYWIQYYKDGEYNKLLKNK